MPQGEGTYGSQVGRPSKKRTSYVNDNGWNNKLPKGDNMGYGTTRRFRKQSGESRRKSTEAPIVGDTVRRGVLAYNEILKDKQLMERDTEFWDQGFKEGISKIVNFGKNLPENFRKKYSETE